MKLKSTQKHFFHLVTSSPWPLAVSCSALLLTLSAVMFFHNYAKGSFLLPVGLVLVIIFKAFWYKDIIREGTFLGDHTFVVQRGLRYGMLLFIVSEVMFFFAFFWAFFHSALAPTFQINCVWPPLGVHQLVFNFFEIPLINTFILLLSGATITWAHSSIINGYFFASLCAFIYTILLAILFITFQGYEYKEASFSIADSVYGSTFFLATGFHGFHVFIGSCFIIVCFFRQIQAHFSKAHHFGFEAAAWYWHFVDVVWLFLVIVVYVWGNSTARIDFILSNYIN